MSIAEGLSPGVGPASTTFSRRVVHGRTTRTAPAAARPDPAAANSSLLLVYVASLLSGLLISLAWFVTETATSAVLGWASAVLLIYSVRARKAYLPACCCGLVVHAVGFYWIYGTLGAFGGFGPIVSASIFALYVVTGSLMFLVFAAIHHNLGPAFDALALRSPVAIVVAELLTIRVFHWHFGHTQVAFTPFVQIAGLGGAMFVSFVMFWLAEAGVRLVLFRERRRAFVIPVFVFLFALGYGALLMATFGSPGRKTQEVLLVQGDPRFAGKRDAESAWQYVGSIDDLSRRSAREATLVVWPEGVIPQYIPADLGSVRNDPALPWLRNGSAFLVGGYAYRSEQEKYNTAFAVYPDGTVPPPYFKQLLIPFGEYMPFASVVPWLNDLNSNAGIFRSGSETRVFAYPMKRRDGTEYTLKVAPLICYEDTVTELAREATKKGAELLVNLTYDTWFGQTAAPFQHHLIAVFRAIENRRFLVRSTSTGYTAVVNPLGKTVAHVRPFAEGQIAVDVGLSNYQSVYTQYVGERPWWALSVVSLGAIVGRRWRKRRRIMESRRANPPTVDFLDASHLPDESDLMSRSTSSEVIR
jgi:apolipoprotein N-acyltransferase